jgi:hypothetical protein
MGREQFQINGFGDIGGTAAAKRKKQQNQNNKKSNRSPHFSSCKKYYLHHSNQLVNHIVRNIPMLSSDQGNYQAFI